MILVGQLWSQRQAGADTRVNAARAHFQQGTAYYRLDKFREALLEFEQAYLAKPDPSFLYNIAQCHRLTGNSAQALKYYRRFLHDESGSPNRAIAEKHVRELELELARQQAGGANPPGAGAPLPAPMPVPVPPPPVEPPTAANPGAAAADVPARRGDVSGPRPARGVAVQALPPAPPSPSTGEAIADGALIQSRSDDGPKPGPKPVYKTWWFWTGVGAVATAGILTAVVLGGADQCGADRACR